MPIQSFSEHKKIHSHTNKHLLTPTQNDTRQKNNNNAANEEIKYCVVFGDSSSNSSCSSSNNIMSAKAFHIPIVFRSGFTITHTHTGTDLFLHAH